jgi:Pyruvate/2-oxoacid:ferredoxin oxidoreductase delta subunit
MEKIIMTGERKRKLRTLVRLMAGQSKKMLPVTRELIDCFAVVLSPEETDFLISMGKDVRRFEELKKCSGLSEISCRETLESLLTKGLIETFPDGSGNEIYKLQAIIVGWFEKYLASGNFTGDKKEFGRRVNAYFTYFYRLNRAPLRGAVNLQNRLLTTNYSIASIPQGKSSKTIKLDATVPVPDKQVYPPRDIDAVVEKYGSEGKIAVMNCFCRRVRESVDEACRFAHPEEVCLGLGDHADYIVRCGLGRRISKDEAMDIIHESERRGAIHTLMHIRDDARLGAIEICNCCWDCCGIFGTYNRGILGLSFLSYYLAKVTDEKSCIGCGKCAIYCPVTAVTVSEGKASIDARRCIGCGQCAFQCNQGVMELVPSERRVVLPMLKRSEARLAVKPSD